MTMLSAGRSLATGQALCAANHQQLWLHYVAVGGSRSSHALRAYILGETDWPAAEHDIVAHALNELCLDLGLGFPVRYADEL